MDARSLGVILLKVAGLVLIAMSVAELPGYFPLARRGWDWSLGEVLATAALSLGPLALLGLLLWLFPGTIANKIVTGPPAPGGETNARSVELIALTVLGLFLVARGLMDGVRDVAFIVVAQRQAPDAMLPPAILAHMAAALAELVIGVGLCIGAPGISRVIARMRSDGP